MEKDIVRLHGLIQYYESIGAWGLAQALRKILTTTIIGSALVLSACATSVRKTWHVHPDDMSQFKADQRRCFEIAALARGDDNLVDVCLQRIGYRLTIDNE
jgi:hypothetical protein